MSEKKRELLPRRTIANLPVSTDTETDRLVQFIAENTSQVSISKADEVSVMQSMLNDENFKIAVFDRTKGYIGSRSPRETALSIINDAICGVTGMGSKEASELSKSYEFTKRDASRYVTITKDFMSTYLQTGRKINVMNDSRDEASINLKYIESHEKKVPDQNGGTKIVSTPARIKLVSSNKIVN